MADMAGYKVKHPSRMTPQDFAELEEALLKIAGQLRPEHSQTVQRGVAALTYAETLLSKFRNMLEIKPEAPLADVLTRCADGIYRSQDEIAGMTTEIAGLDEEDGVVVEPQILEVNHGH